MNCKHEHLDHCSGCDMVKCLDCGKTWPPQTIVYPIVPYYPTYPIHPYVPIPTYPITPFWDTMPMISCQSF